jgi:small subunit ribosomal protein S7
MRRKRTFKREPNPDPKYGSVLVTKFINRLMQEGKKSTAQSIFYEALETAAKDMKKENPLEIIEEAIKNASPLLEVKSRRVGGANYQVPYEVKGKRREALAIRWVIEVSRKKKGAAMAKKLAKELTDAYNNIGDAVKKKEDMHKVAEANRAFAHFAW